MEGVVLVLVALLPWAFGGVDPLFELVLAVGIALLLLGWAAVACVNGRLSFARCPVTLCLAVLFLIGALQLVPLPPWILKVVSPGTASLNSELLPHTPEQLTVSDPPIASSPLRPISVYPHATRSDLFHWLEVLILFAVVRHQLASTASLRRLAAVATITGIAIALFRGDSDIALGHAKGLWIRNRRHRIWTIHQSQSRGLFFEFVRRLGGRTSRLSKHGCDRVSPTNYSEAERRARTT